LRDTDVQEVFKKLIEGMIRITYNKDGQRGVVVKSFPQKCPNE
jgi:hypothetical protein